MKRAESSRAKQSRGGKESRDQSGGVSAASGKKEKEAEANLPVSNIPVATFQSRTFQWQEGEGGPLGQPSCLQHSTDTETLALNYQGLVWETIAQEWYLCH